MLPIMPHTLEILNQHSCPVKMAADTLTMADSGAAVRNLTTATDVYGTGVLVPSYVDTLAITNHYSTAFQSIVLVLFLLYIIIVLQFRHQTKTMLRSAWGSESDRSDEHDLSDTVFKALVMLCGGLLCGVMAVWSVNLWHTQLDIAPLFSAIDWTVTSLLATIVLGIAFIQRLALKTAGSLTLTTDFIRFFNAKRFALFGSMTIITVPLVLSGVLVCSTWSFVTFWGAATAIVSSSLLALWKSFYLFVKQKISILVWILYLCSVELLPITVVVFTAFRHWSV